jgi:hypothetical protein
MTKFANRNVRDFGGRGAHAAVSRRPLTDLHDCSSCRGLHVRRESLGFVHRPVFIFCRPVPNLVLRFAFFLHRCMTRVRVSRWQIHGPHSAKSAVANSSNAITLTHIMVTIDAMVASKTHLNIDDVRGPCPLARPVPLLTPVLNARAA